MSNFRIHEAYPTDRPITFVRSNEYCSMDTRFTFSQFVTSSASVIVTTHAIKFNTHVRVPTIY